MTFFVPCILKANSQELNVGDLVPEIEFRNVINYRSSAIRLSDFRNKLVILDFWDFSCVSCLEGFYKIDSIQKNFPKKLQIILVNTQTPELTRDFFTKRPKLLKPHIPFITADTILGKLFPHEGVPFHVWIDANGRVLYKADGNYTTLSNVRSALNGTNLDLPAPKPNIYVNSFFIDKVRGSLQYFSFISQCDPNYWLEPRDSSKYEGIITCNCFPVIKLFQTAFDSLTGNKYHFSWPGRTLLEVQDPRKYVLPRDNNTQIKWLSENAFDYQQKLPVSKSSQRYNKMKDDIQEYFNLHGSVQHRKIKCLELIRTSNKDKLRSTGGIPRMHFFMWDLRSANEDTSRYAINEPFNKFFGVLRRYVEKAFNGPLIDKTGYLENIDIRIDGSVIDSLNLAGFKRELNKYDLDLVESTIYMNVLVISENSGKSKEGNSE